MKDNHTFQHGRLVHLPVRHDTAKTAEEAARIAATPLAQEEYADLYEIRLDDFNPAAEEYAQRLERVAQDLIYETQPAVTDVRQVPFLEYVIRYWLPRAGAASRARLRRSRINPLRR
jgi:hypothetical protein